MQFGFMKNKGTIDAIFVVRQMQEILGVKSKKLHIGFVNLEKAFDRVQRELDGCIVWNAHNTVLGEEALLIHIVPVGYAT